MTAPDQPPRAGQPRADVFAVLGLAPRPDLTDDQVRAAWQRFAVAAAAYTTLRTGFGRGEALADLAAGRAPGGGAGRRSSVTPRFAGLRSGRAARWAARVRGGRPRRLALRVLTTLAASAVAVAAAGFHPAAPALVTGAVTWLACTARRDLAPPR